jgi:hypothetical protein
MGVDYLWIDSLYILQDFKEDWQHEASMMGRVYSHSWCTLAATDFQEDGLITSKTHLNFSCIIETSTAKSNPKPGVYCMYESKDYYGLYGYDERERVEKEVGDVPQNKRGWVLQERLLSPRVPHFTRGLLFWECLSKRFLRQVMCLAQNISTYIRW